MKKIGFFLVALLTAGCASDFSENAVDFCAEGNYQNCDTSVDAGDCIQDCKTPIVETTDTYLSYFDGNTAQGRYNTTDGYIGKIDNSCVEYTTDPESFSGDIDFIAIQATPGTPLRVSVQRVSASMTQPLVLLYDSRGGELIFSMTENQSFTTMQFLAPEEKFYLSIAESSNYRYDGLPYCSEMISSGDDYRYLLQIENADIEVENLGMISSNTTHQAQLENIGDTHYTQFKTPADIDKIQITLSTSDGDHYPVLSPLRRNTTQIGYTGGYEWVLSGALLATRDAETGLSHYEIPKEYAQCDEDNCEFWVVTTDYNSSADYTYTLQIQLGG